MHSQRVGEAPISGKILIATDLTAQPRVALDNAIDLAKRTGTPLVILHVFTTTFADDEKASSHAECNAAYERAAQAIDEERDIVSRAGVQCEGFVARGAGADAILDTIASQNIGLTLVGKRAFDGFAGIVSGSSGEEVFRRARCPVITVGPRIPSISRLSVDTGPIVLATDFDAGSDSALKHALSFARTLDAELHCLHVLPRMLEDGDHSTEIPKVVTGALQHMMIAAGYPSDRATYAVRFGGEVSNAIVNYAEQQKARLVVLSIRSNPASDAALGQQIVYRVLCESPCPVLTVSRPAPCNPSTERQRQLDPGVTSV